MGASDAGLAQHRFVGGAPWQQDQALFPQPGQNVELPVGFDGDQA